MNFFVKACMTVLMVAIGILPAVALHSESLPAIGGESAPRSGDVAAPPELSDVPPEAAEPEPVEVPEVEEPSWWDWTRRSSEEPTEADELDEGLGDDARADPDDEAEEATGGCSYYDRSGCGPADGYGQTEPTTSPYDPYQPTPETTETEPAPTEPAEDEGLLGGILGG